MGGGGWRRSLVKNFKRTPNIIFPTVPLNDALGSSSLIELHLRLQLLPSPPLSLPPPPPPPPTPEVVGRLKRESTDSQRLSLQSGRLDSERLRRSAVCHRDGKSLRPRLLTCLSEKSCARRCRLASESGLLAMAREALTILAELTVKSFNLHVVVGFYCFVFFFQSGVLIVWRVAAFKNAKPANQILSRFPSG